jgi:hypothetical protein
MVYRILTVNWVSIVFVLLGLYLCITGVVNWWVFLLILWSHIKISTDFRIRTPF